MLFAMSWKIDFDDLVSVNSQVNILLCDNFFGILAE